MQNLSGKNRLITIRKAIHRHPELPGEEYQTAKHINRLLEEMQPDQLFTGVGGYGILALFAGEVEGPSVLFRAELDAVPVSEENRFAYASDREGISHACGHDGHMAILLGLAEKISSGRSRRGRIYLLFQPSEETGEGAGKVLEDETFRGITPDYVFALHNLPGYPKHAVVVREGIYMPASKGLIIRLTGKTSHAAEPDKGFSPAVGISQIIQGFHQINHLVGFFREEVRITVTHLEMGKKGFGISPGEGQVYATVRAHDNEDMLLLISSSEKMIREICKRENLAVHISYTEEFPVSCNHPQAVEMIRQVAAKLELKVIEPGKPLPFSEDFSRFLEHFPGAIFGIGAGVNHLPLHSSQYDFPDDIIPAGIRMLYGLYEEITG